jgi:hypothetical protein
MHNLRLWRSFGPACGYCLRGQDTYGGPQVRLDDLVGGERPRIVRLFGRLSSDARHSTVDLVAWYWNILVEEFLLLPLIDCGIGSEVTHVRTIGSCIEIDLDYHRRDIETFWFF